MRMVLGIVGLMIGLTIVGVLAKKQLHANDSLAAVSAAAGASEPASGSVAQQARRIEDKVRDDVTRAMQQAPARLEEKSE
ncbi:MAG: hypothetical protein JWP52_1050 [Rhizobacter sp.]|nr:hypothetical protein [Rhizobacter sp.]